MAVVGDVGYIDTLNTIEFTSGNTYVKTPQDSAGADGYLKSVTIYKGVGAGTIKVSAWEFVGGTGWIRKGFVNLSVPAISGLVVVPIVTPLYFKIGWLIGIYNPDFSVFGGGGKNHKHIEGVGDIDFLGPLTSLQNNAPTLWGELDDQPPSSVRGRPFYLGV